MNILILTSVYPQPDDGSIPATKTVQYFAKEWKKTGNNIIIIHNSSKFPIAYYCLSKFLSNAKKASLGFEIPLIESRRKLHYRECNNEVYRLPMFKVIPHSMFLDKQINIQVGRIVKILKEHEFIPEVIISHWVNPQLKLMLKLNDIYRTRTSLVFHGDCSSNVIEKLGLYENLKHIDAIGCRSTKEARYVKEKCRMEKMPFVCRSGIPRYVIKETRKLKISKIPCSYIYVGRLLCYKNVDSIIMALKNVFPNKEFYLEIIGTGPNEEKLKKLVNQMELKDNVVFKGQLSRDEVFDALRKSEVFTMVSKNEVFGMVYLEAMGAGCITVASNDGEMNEIIQNGENGFLCTPGDESGLSLIYKQIKSMTKEHKEIMSYRAIETAELYTDDKVAASYLNCAMSWQQKRDNI